MQARHAGGSVPPWNRGVGRRTILWSAVDHDQVELTEEEPDELAE